MIAADCGDAAVCFDDFILKIPAREAGFNGNKDYARLRQARVNDADKVCVLGHDGIRRFSGGQVIVTGIQYNHAGMIWDQDAFCEGGGIVNFRAAEASVDDLDAGEILGHGRPLAKGGTANE